MPQFLFLQAALLAFGPGVFRPSEQTKATIKQCVSEARHGKVPESISTAYSWISTPEYPLPLAYEVDLRIIGSAILGGALISYLLKVSTCCPSPIKGAHHSLLF